MKTKIIYRVKFQTYTKLNSIFKTRKAAIAYIEKLLNQYGMNVYIDSRIIKTTITCNK